MSLETFSRAKPEEGCTMIRFDEVTKTWEVSYSKRHPITRIPCRGARKGIKSQAEAKRIYSELVVQVNDKIRRQSVPTWWSMVESYCETSRNRGLTEKTIDNYLLCLKAHTFEVWGDRLIDTISTQEIRNLLKDRVGNRSASHQKSVLKFIRAIFHHAVEQNVIARNPTPDLKIRIGDKIKKVLTEPQIKLLLEKARDLDIEWYPHWALALYTGMRNGELYALTWDKVDFQNRTILIDSSWNNKDSFKSTKSGDDRIVEIAEPLIPILQELKIKSFDSNFVLPRIDKWDKGEQARELRMFLVGIGLHAVRFHDLRASWATLLLKRGVEPVKVMKAGGWKDIKTMMIYVRKAGIDIMGITNGLVLHEHAKPEGRLIKLANGSNP